MIPFAGFCVAEIHQVQQQFLDSFDPSLLMFIMWSLYTFFLLVNILFQILNYIYILVMIWLERVYPVEVPNRFGSCDFELLRVTIAISTASFIFTFIRSVGCLLIWLLFHHPSGLRWVLIICFGFPVVIDAITVIFPFGFTFPLYLLFFIFRKGFPKFFSRISKQEREKHSIFAPLKEQYEFMNEEEMMGHMKGIEEEGEDSSETMEEEVFIELPEEGQQQEQEQELEQGKDSKKEEEEKENKDDRHDDHETKNFSIKRKKKRVKKESDQIQEGKGKTEEEEEINNE